jgi:alpha,alpha-trehalose-phosphate synthase [UDP-forming]
MSLNATTMKPPPDTQSEVASLSGSTLSPDAHGADLVVVANRLPVRHSSELGDDVWLPSPGGLVSALTAVLQNRNGLWIGWPGTSEPHEIPSTYEGIRLKAVEITADEYEEYYLGFSNATLWPLYHDAIRAPTFHRHWWQAYRTVNERYANAVAESAAPGALVWIHDYQLQLVPQMLRALRPDLRIGFFMHIPFPPNELFIQLPWRREILVGLLGADLIGFQVHSAASNFSRIARRVVGASGTGASLVFDGRVIRVGAFPISVDSVHINELVKEPAVQARAQEIREEMGNPELILLGVDRLDYTKGIEQRIKAVAELFAEGLLVAKRHVMVQIAVPSRESDAHYDRERHKLEQSVSAVNGEFAHLGSPVVHYIHKNLPFEELVALYLAADIMMVTPFRDGMNLVAKEYVVSRADLTGRLVLSEFAGAAEELRGAYKVNPHDLESIKMAIRAAKAASAKETRARMSRMRRKTDRRDVFDWAQSFLSALQAQDTAGLASSDD